MNVLNKKLVLSLFSLFICISQQGFAQEAKKPDDVTCEVNHDVNHKDAHHHTIRELELVEPGEVKKPLCIEAGDCKLTFGGATKIEHFFLRNQTLLNKDIPDEQNYFKHMLALTFDLTYGEKKFDHKALELFTDIRHKGVWGKGKIFADSSDGTTPANIKLSRSLFGEHSHSTGKPLIYFNQGWLQFSFNAITNSDSECRHFLKLGWFPFQLGRGIALGGYYGLGRSDLAFYSYGDDKSAPGINLNGTIIEDILAYDLYYSKFQSRSSSFSDTFNNVKEQLVGHKAFPSRGVGKDNDLIAGRLKWKAMDSDQYGKLEVEPYVFYNAASDQKTKVPNDTTVKFGSVGLALEHSVCNFEIGGEVAVNYGDQLIRASDNNMVTTKRDDANGYLREQFTNIIDNSTGKTASVNSDSSKAASLEVSNNDDTPLAAPGIVGSYRSTNKKNHPNEKDRFTPSYKNDFRGWMFVTDLAYNFKDQDLTLAGAYGYASGDNDPNNQPTNTTYKGFVGVHELYSGKRVSSVILLDERNLDIPVPLVLGASEADDDFGFTDMHHVGVGLTWEPTFACKKCTFNPNILAFWKAHTGKKFDLNFVDPVTGKKGKVSTEDASNFMGTELNLISECELLKNFRIYGIFAAFVPGQYFKDVTGVPFDKDPLLALEQNGVDVDGIDPADFRLNSNAAYHVNVGFEYKF